MTMEQTLIEMSEALRGINESLGKICDGKGIKFEVNCEMIPYPKKSGEVDSAPKENRKGEDNVRDLWDKWREFKRLMMMRKETTDENTLLNIDLDALFLSKAIDAGFLDIATMIGTKSKC